MSLLSVHNLTIKYRDRTIVDHVDFTVEQGDIVAIIGPNGSGKTTLLKAIMGILPVSEGGIHWETPPCFGYVPQRIDLEHGFPLTVEELLLLRLPDRPLWHHNKSVHDYIENELKRVGAGRLIEKRVSELSGGELQRVLIAYALIGKPTVLCLDEPSSGVDIEGEEAIYNLIHRLAEQEKLTVLLVSHDLDVVFKYASKVVCVNQKLICQGVPSKVLTPEVLKQAYAGPARYHHDHAH